MPGPLCSFLHPSIRHSSVADVLMVILRRDSETVRIWDRHNGRCLRTLHGHRRSFDPQMASARRLFACPVRVSLLLAHALLVVAL